MVDQKGADARAFRAALGNFATGITIVTTWSEQHGDVGVTANSFNSVSLDPPMILWSLSRKSRSMPAFLASKHFAVHVLAADQEALSGLFATSGAEKFAELTLDRGIGHVPLLQGCAARFECSTAFLYEGGDHVIQVGEVHSFDTWLRAPLLYHAGRYALAVEKHHQSEGDASWSSEPDGSFSRDFLVYLLARAHAQVQRYFCRELERLSISEHELYVLSMLGVSEDRTVAELDRLLWSSGPRVTYDLVARLAATGLVRLQGGHDPDARSALTDRGRQVLVELISAAKAGEADVERDLGTTASYQLKSALLKLIASTDPGPPPLLTDPEAH